MTTLMETIAVNAFVGACVGALSEHSIRTGRYFGVDPRTRLGRYLTGLLGAP